jgi:hypothetical protein
MKLTAKQLEMITSDKSSVKGTIGRFAISFNGVWDMTNKPIKICSHIWTDNGCKKDTYRCILCGKIEKD